MAAKKSIEPLGGAYLYQNNCQREASGEGPISLWEPTGVGLDQVVDGTSTTILFAENAGKPDLWIRGVKTVISDLLYTPADWRTMVYPVELRRLLGLYRHKLDCG